MLKAYFVVLPAPLLPLLPLPDGDEVLPEEPLPMLPEPLDVARSSRRHFSFSSPVIASHFVLELVAALPLAPVLLPAPTLAPDGEDVLPLVEGAELLPDALLPDEEGLLLDGEDALPEALVPPLALEGEEVLLLEDGEEVLPLALEGEELLLLDDGEEVLPDALVPALPEPLAPLELESCLRQLSLAAPVSPSHFALEPLEPELLAAGGVDALPPLEPILPDAPVLWASDAVESANSAAAVAVPRTFNIRCTPLSR